MGGGKAQERPDGMPEGTEDGKDFGNGGPPDASNQTDAPNQTDAAENAEPGQRPEGDAEPPGGMGRGQGHCAGI